MDKDRTENFESPLDQVFDDLPQENPPTDLQQRCVNALDEIDAERGIWSAPQWFLSLRNVIATAAVLVLAVGLFTLLPLFMSAKKAASPTASLSSERQLRVAAQPPLGPPAEAGDELRPITARIAPSPRPAEDVIARLEAPRGDATDAWGDDRLGLERQRLSVDQMEAAEERAAVGSRFQYKVGRELAGTAPESGTGIDYFYARTPAEGQPPSVIVTRGSVQQAPSEARAPQVEEPWRDLSGERQVVVDKELELEVKDVEKSYDEARLIVEKHGGFVASDEISIDAHALDTAVLTIRLPKDGFEAAITELRELGRVLKLVGESQDVTREYFSQGAQIRSRADREQMLVEKYEKETNPRKKSQLKAEIEQLRREMRREKEILTKLAEETHWPALQLTLKERGGPAGFLSEMLERSGHALAWVGATAIIWVPLVVLLTLFWGRLRRTSQ